MRISVALIVSLLAGLVNCTILPFHYSGPPVHAVIIREATKNALKEHVKNPQRCSQIQVINLISQDAERQFIAKTGLSQVPKMQHQCTKCNMVFDDYANAYLHIC